MNDHSQKQRARHVNWSFWFAGIGSLAGLLLRSGLRPHRLVYPCQRAALAHACGFVGYLLSLLGSARIGHRLRRGFAPARVLLLALLILIPLGLLGGSASASAPLRAPPPLPAWTSPSAVSDLFVVGGVPLPPCSLDGGALPAAPPCDDAEFALHDDGVEALVQLMASKGTYFYQTAVHRDGIVGPNDVVVIKINNQWGGNGSGDGLGRLATNSDVLKGLVWRIVQHPEGFGGEVVVAENTQPISAADWDVTPANAQDPNQSFQDVVDAFRSLGYAVSLYNWTALNQARIHGGAIDDADYPTVEYAHGDLSDAYVMLEDPAGTGADELSYPKFQTAYGTYVSMRYGIWEGSSYDADRLKTINLPVLKRHGRAGATIAWKNLIGFVTAAGVGARYGDFDEMHDYFFGQVGGPNHTYGLLGREMALVRAPDLHLVDAIWVAYENNAYGEAIRQDVLLASRDPFAVDWYASEYVLSPLTGSQDTSAARAGTFRNATRINQNAAELMWPGGSEAYPYMDLLDDCDGSTPVDEEVAQMNVYVVDTRTAVYLPLISSQ